MTDSPTLTIGRVRKLLNDEFPDVTTSKIRFLETNGLVHPARSPSGYRHFRQSDVDRLRFILRQQRDHFLPLKVIKSQLTRLERGELPGGGVEPEEALPVPEIADETFSLNELARRSDLTRAQVRQLLDHGLLAPLNAEGPHQFTTGDVAVARQCGVLLAEGLEPRHIRQVRQAVSRQVELLDRLTLAMRLSPSQASRRQAARTLSRGAEAIRLLSQSFLQADVKALLGKD
ncbi:MAG: MerR family transcriptional regulator [Acidimicrobiia bacterium]|nr:MerR family transcriptional regulator [Acidimicrobiia bacterium]